ncbi:hypothetical protein EIP86_002058 [Pleurotus ostreatoroseus]|nr:hypothetical protein EIP86_002058 [Pleurotus ostreatoroseus]
MSSDQIAELYGSITQVMMYPTGDPVREGVSNAYDDVMKIICIIATCISVLPLICNLFLKDYFLGDKQNAVDELDLQGELSDTPSLTMTDSHEK